MAGYPRGAARSGGRPASGRQRMLAFRRRAPAMGAAAAAYKSVVATRTTIDGVGYAPWLWARRGVWRLG